MTSDALAKELIETLVEELRDQTAAMREEVEALARGSDARASLETLYRIAHTLKGASRAAGVSALEEACRGLEARVVGARNRGTLLSAAELASLRASVEALAQTAVRLASGAPATDSGAADAPVPTTTLRALAVEDSPTQAAKLREALRRGGYAVVEARTGEEALQLAMREPVDFVVSDVMMPGAVDGYELCRRIKRDHAELPVILLTDLSDPLDVIRGLEAGADSFLTKPYEPEDLRARLEQLFANRRERAARVGGTGLSLRFQDRQFLIESSREQILDLLVTTFDDAVRQNRELQQALSALENAQEELARKERLAVLGRLSGSVGHELRNPLGVMTNAVYFLTMVIKDPPEKVTEYLGILRHQITLSEKIVGDLLDFARIKQPKLDRTTVAKVIKDQMARIVVPQNVRVDTRLPETLPTVEIDVIQVGQVVLNLITNGIQAMDETGVER